MPLLDASALDQDLEQLASLFRLLSDKTRLNILLSLARGERNVSSLCKELELPQPTVSHHLGLLRVNNTDLQPPQGQASLLRPSYLSDVSRRQRPGDRGCKLLPSHRPPRRHASPVPASSRKNRPVT